MKIRINTQKAQDSSGGQGTYEPIPEGTYDLRIDKVEQRTSKKGVEQLMIGMTVLGPTSQGSKHTEWFALTEAAMWRLYNLFSALGIAPSPTDAFDEQGNQLDDYDSDELIGRVITAAVKIEEYFSEKEGKNKRNNKLDKDFEISQFDPNYEAYQKALAEAANSATAGAAPAAAPAQAPAPAQAAAAPVAGAPVVVGRRGRIGASA